MLINGGANLDAKDKVCCFLSAFNGPTTQTTTASVLYCKIKQGDGVMKWIQL